MLVVVPPTPWPPLDDDSMNLTIIHHHQYFTDLFVYTSLFLVCGITVPHAFTVNQPSHLINISPYLYVVFHRNVFALLLV